MVRGQTKDGVHQAQREDPKLSKDMLALLKTQDEAYVNTKRQSDLKKADRIKERIHGTSALKPSTRLVFIDSAEATTGARADESGRKRQRSEMSTSVVSSGEAVPALIEPGSSMVLKGKAAQRLAAMGVLGRSEGPVSQAAARDIQRETRRITKRRRLSAKAADRLAVQRADVVQEATQRSKRAKLLGRAQAHL